MEYIYYICKSIFYEYFTTIFKKILEDSTFYENISIFFWLFYENIIPVSSDYTFHFNI